MYGEAVFWGLSIVKVVHNDEYNKPIFRLLLHKKNGCLIYLFFQTAPHSEFLLYRECVYKPINSHTQTARTRTTLCRSHKYLFCAGIVPATRSAAAISSATAPSVTSLNHISSFIYTT